MTRFAAFAHDNLEVEHVERVDDPDHGVSGQSRLEGGHIGAVDADRIGECLLGPRRERNSRMARPNPLAPRTTYSSLSSAMRQSRRSAHKRDRPGVA